MFVLPSTGLEARLARKPSGLPTADVIAIVETPLPRPAANEVLVRNIAFRLSPTIRMMISEGAENVEGVPFPALRVGEVLREEALGEVIAAPDGHALGRGDLVLHHYGWRDYAAVPVANCLKVSRDVTDINLHLSHGWTAYAALTRGLNISHGDTVFISSAAGAIGSMAGQIARLLGADKVIGSTSTRAKADRLIRELGYDAAVIRGAGAMAGQLAKAAPQGIDAVLDSAGGEALQAAVEVARERARILVIGALSGQLDAKGTGRRAPVELDSFKLLLKKLTIRGYSADDDPDARREWDSHLGRCSAAGQIRFPHEIVRGLRHAPEALAKASRGEFFGAVLVVP
ncbi:alcohol dehydrogenase [Bradyrhizobium sp. LTSP885]|uniref:MDR family NADP-dependent oxidoreductase n=1 Tax=Bradyrhizobium sp. LTSP885 TaxID=1619232 RepID=UPI0005CA9D6F|nr:NADP-dependent oxidoreductase [Bradyrhizobium sp. LTSP885]KJC39367.1 alcohol dehydrogenase [Bradyrhizobium sp. LTSP885]